MPESIVARNHIMPFLKWVGGKRQIMTSLLEHFPHNLDTYHYIEPFVGGGAVLFHLQPENATINDFNEELINVYKVIKNNPEELLTDLKKHKNEKQYFYKIRALGRTEALNHLTPVQRASRIIYLNKTCYNGLYRVNKAGEFNVPFGRYKKPNFVNEPVIKAVSKFLNRNNIVIKNEDYEMVLKDADDKTFVYLDPPYHPVSQSSNFTDYIQGGWDKSEQIRLKETCDRLNLKGGKFLLSNSSADFIKDLYRKYIVITVKANRIVNSKSTSRGEINEVLIKNYK